jgi:hypothetical protein
MIAAAKAAPDFLKDFTFLAPYSQPGSKPSLALLYPVNKPKFYAPSGVLIKSNIYLFPRKSIEPLLEPSSWLNQGSL